MDRTVRVGPLAWFAGGFVVAVLATLMATEAWRVDAAPGDDDATFVPITPCRLTDTRPEPDRVGTATTFGPAETVAFVAHGAQGECVLPSDAVGLSLNVTAVRATLPTFLTVWPGGDRPLASSLNPSPGEPPVPNAVTTPLATDGSFRVFNFHGNVDVIIDVNGYFTNASLQALAQRVAVLEADNAAMGSRLTSLEAAEPFSVSDHEAGSLALQINTISVVDVVVTAPVDGHVTVTYSAHVSNNGSAVHACAPYRATEIPSSIVVGAEGVSSWESDSSVDAGSLAGTRRFAIAGGQTVTFSVACQEFPSDGVVSGRTITAVFTPLP